MKKNKQGFTIVELIIVVLMIGVLMTIGFISMTKYVGDSQDARVAADMKTIDDKLDLAFVSLKKYPMPDNIYSTGMLDGKVVSYAGYAGENVSRIIGLNAPIVNPTNGEMYRYAVNVNRTKTQIATLKKDKVNFLVGGNFDGKIKTSSGETVIPSIVYVNTGSVDLKNDTLVYLGGSSSAPPAVVEDPEFTGNCLVDLKPADVDALNYYLITNTVNDGYADPVIYWLNDSEQFLTNPLTKEEWCALDNISSLATGLQILEIPRAIGKLNNLKSLNLTSYGLTSIPDSIGYLSNLEYLDLSQNSITSIPPSIGNLDKLKTLNLNDNGLVDIPNEVFKLIHLNELHVAGNDLDFYDFGDSFGRTAADFQNLLVADLRNNPQLGGLQDLYDQNGQSGELNASSSSFEVRVDGFVIFSWSELNPG